MLGNQLEINNNINETKAKTPFFKRGIFIYISIILVIISFSAGVIFGDRNNKIKITSVAGETQQGELLNKDTVIPEYLSRDVDFKVFWQAWNLIQEKYVEKPIGETQLFYGAMNGMLNSLGDPFSTFLEPKVAEEFTDELSGKFEGVGMEIGLRNDVLTVISPLVGTPAEKAGIRAADVITEIDGVSTEGIDLYDAVNKIRGDKGTVVTFKIYRAKTNEFLDIQATRDVIKVVSVEYKIYRAEDFEILGDKKISLIKITNFNSDTAGRFKEAVQKVILDSPDGLILDLRSNPGGYLDSSIEIADYWLNKGDVVVKESFSDKPEELYLAENDAVLGNFKTVVLINGGSASASEIVSGALQDFNKAVVVGEKSFGKGSVQELIDLDDGSAIKITIARWLTPNGRIIDKEGIMPDIEVEMTEEAYNNFLDPQLDRAIEYFVE